jgi:hypothetical protein
MRASYDEIHRNPSLIHDVTKNELFNPEESPSIAINSLGICNLLLCLQIYLHPEVHVPLMWAVMIINNG